MGAWEDKRRHSNMKRRVRRRWVQRNKEKVRGRVEWKIQSVQRLSAAMHATRRICLVHKGLFGLD